MFQILSANEQATKLFECSSMELMGKKLSSILKKPSKDPQEAFEEDYPLPGGNVVAVSAKVVRNILHISCIFLDSWLHHTTTNTTK